MILFTQTHACSIWKMFQCLSQLYHKSVSLVRAVVIRNNPIAKLLAYL